MKIVTTLFVLSFSIASQAWVCQGTSTSATAVLAFSADELNGLPRVQQSKIDDVTFLVWEVGPFPQNAQSSKMMGMIYNPHQFTDAKGFDFSKDGSVFSVSMKNENDTYTLTCTQ